MLAVLSVLSTWWTKFSHKKSGKVYLANLQKPLRVFSKGFEKIIFFEISKMKTLKGFEKRVFCENAYRRVFEGLWKTGLLEFCLEHNIIDQLSICTTSKCPKPKNNSVKTINGTFTHNEKIVAVLFIGRQEKNSKTPFFQNPSKTRKIRKKLAFLLILLL